METKTADEESLPSWVDAAFMANALKTVDPKLDESSVKISSTCKVRGGLLGETFRVAVLHGDPGSEKETEFIVKSAPAAAGIRKQMLDRGVFTRERAAYRSFLSAVNAALESVEGREWQPLAPKLYLEGADPTSFMVLEDLGAASFRKASYADNLDLEHCRAVVRNIARMHAASVPLVHHEQYAQKIFRESLLFSRKVLEAENGRMTEAFKKIVEDLSEYPWFVKYKKKLEEFSPSAVIRTVEVVEQCNVDFKVMVHGDLHKNNMMFRAGEDGLQVRLYDFQGLHVGSPAEDLQYFLHCSASLEVVRDHTDLLLSEYHGTLQRTMRALGLQQQADAYPLDQLHKDMEHFGTISVFCTFFLLPVILGDIGNLDFELDPSQDNYQEKADSLRKNLWKNERFLAYVECLIPVFDSKGLFETQNA